MKRTETQKVFPQHELRNWFAFRVRQLREQKGLTQLQLSELSGVARPNITNIEAGKYNVRLDTLQKLCHALECDIDFIER